mgnify:CR=1 FL=1
MAKNPIDPHQNDTRKCAARLIHLKKKFYFFCQGRFIVFCKSLLNNQL